MPANTLQLNFTGGTFKGQYPSNNLKLNFICATAVTKREAALNFWGASVKDTASSSLTYQVI